MQYIRTIFSHPLRLALTLGFFMSFLTVAATPFVRVAQAACDVYAPNLMTECNCDIPNPDNKADCLDDYYSSNGITLYDPNTPICEASPSTAATSSTDMTGNDNAEKIFRYLIGKGLTAEQAAGVMGNLYAESRLDPAIEQGGRIVDATYILIPNVGFGLAQWTAPSRQDALMEFQRNSGKTIIDLGMQMDFLWLELSNSSLAALKATTTPEDAAYIFHRDFERSADSEATVLANRGGKAREFYEQFKALAPSSPASTNPTSISTNCAVTPGAGTNSGSADLLSDSFVIYNQCQYPPFGGPWGTIPTLGGRNACSDACTPTSLAMISKNLAGMNVTPENTIDYWSQHLMWYPGGGSLTTTPLQAAGDFGLRIETIANKGDINAYKAVFDQGGAVMALAAGSSPFLPQGHAIVLRGIVNGGASFLIADPGYTNTNYPPANQPSVDKILTDMRSDGASVAYAFYKK